MKRPTDAQLNRLLAGKNEITEPDRELVLANVLSGVKRSRRVRRMNWVLGAGVLAGVAATVTLVFMPSVNADFQARGTAQPTVELSCHADSPCRMNDQLFFRITNPEGCAYLTLFAKSAQGDVIWYLEQFSVSRGTPVLERAVTLDASHGTGDFEVSAIFSTSPLDRPSCLSALERPEMRCGMASAALHVEP